MANKNRPGGQQGIVLGNQTAFSEAFPIICGGKNGKTQSGHVRLRARVAMKGGLLSVHM